MKRNTITSAKTARLSVALKIPRYAAVGILESLWHATAQWAQRGDIGKVGADGIAHYVAWDRDPEELVNALIECRWLDRLSDGTIVVHDWSEHCDDAVHMYLARRIEFFADGSMPRLNRLGKQERERIAASYESMRAPSTRKHTASLSVAPPMPLPCPAPPLPCPAPPCPPTPSPAALPPDACVRMVEDDDARDVGAADEQTPCIDPIPVSLLDELVRHYPRPEAKAAAYPEIQAAIRRVSQAQGTDIRGAHGWLLARVKAYRRSDAGRGPQRFIPLPGRWFSEERYMDDDSAWVRDKPDANAPAAARRAAQEAREYD